MPKKTWDNRYYELFFRIFVECTHIFNDFLNQLFAPPPPDEDQSSCKDFRKSLVVKVVWERKTVRFKVPVPKPPPSGKKYTCNGYHHKPGCTCGWGPRPGSGQGKAAVKTVTKKIWVPAVYIVPAGQKPPVVI
jgi:hypothetical protein